MDFEAKTRAYSLHRPISIGTYPKPKSGRFEIHNFDERRFAPEIHREAWGYIDYEDEIPETELESHEMMTAGMVHRFTVVLTRGDAWDDPHDAMSRKDLFYLARMNSGDTGVGFFELMTERRAREAALSHADVFADCMKRHRRLSDGGRMPDCEVYRLVIREFTGDEWRDVETVMEAAFFGDAEEPDKAYTRMGA